MLERIVGLTIIALLITLVCLVLDLLDENEYLINLNGVTSSKIYELQEKVDSLNESYKYCTYRRLRNE